MDATTNHQQTPDGQLSPLMAAIACLSPVIVLVLMIGACMLVSRIPVA
jgi:hypothetical protein